jgi:U3 small nucleolar RNA-associated protein 4
LKNYEHHAASHLHFTNDSSKLILGTIPGSHVAILQLPESKHGEVSVLRVFSQHRSRNAYSRALAGRNGTTAEEDGEGDDTSSDSDEDESDEIVPSLACMTTSNDGQWLITGDMTGRLHVFNLDSLQYHAALPSVELPPVDMAFSPSNASIVVVALPNNTIQAFDVDQRTIPTWAQYISRNTFATFTNLREPILGVTFDPVPEAGRHADTLVIYGSTFIGTMKLSPSEQLELPLMTIEKRKRDGDTTATTNGTEEKQAEEDNEESSGEETDGETMNTSINRGRSTIEVTFKYQPVLFLDFTTQGDMVVVEKPYFSMLSQMAPAFSAKKYGNT